MFIKTLQIMLRKDLIHQIIQSTDNCIEQKQKNDWINER